MATKQDIRKHILRVRDEITLENQLAWSREIENRFFEMEDCQYANVFYFYASFGKEVMTQEIIEAVLMQGKRVALPRVNGDTMDFYEIHNFEELKPGYMGILEPVGNVPMDVPPDVVIMPGVAFDENKNRIGYGKGYYDRFLSSIEETTKIAFAFECQIVDEIPAEAFDYRPDRIVTEYRLIR